MFASQGEFAHRLCSETHQFRPYLRLFQAAEPAMEWVEIGDLLAQVSVGRHVQILMNLLSFFTSKRIIRRIEQSRMCRGSMQVGDEIQVGIALLRKTRDAQPMGIYKPTAVDAQKASVDFRLTDVGRKNRIVWRTGEVDYVTPKALEALQAVHSWATDF
jgi:hypothetical protein